MEFRMLGPLEFAAGGERIDLPGRKLPRLLAMLLCRAGSVVSADQLIEALRDERNGAMSRKALQIQVHRLRRALGEQDVIGYRPPGYLALLEPSAIDAHRFESLAAEGRGALAAGRHPHARQVLREALALWRGQPLAGLHDVEPLREEAARLTELRLSATGDRIEAELRLGLHAELVAELQQLVDEHPLREHFRAQLMLALYRCGRQAEALETCREARRLLLEELGVDPGLDLRQLELAMLAGDPALDPQTVPIRQVAAQLPHDIADFTGRRELVDRITEALAPGHTIGVVVLAGRGGVGKTTLAVHASHLLRPSFPDGQLYVNLAGTAEEPLVPVRVLGRFLRALGVDSSAIPDGLEERAELYRQRLAERRVLVVLDDASGDAQIGPLLPGSGSCAVIVTSRAALPGLAGGSHLLLDQFEAAEAVHLMARIAGGQRVAAEPAAAAQIGRLCGHLPLAIRIAAARLAARPRLPLSGMVAKLTDAGRRLDVLALGDLGVRACFALSYRALPQEARRAFRLLGLLDIADFAGWVPAAMLGVPVAQAESLTDALVDAQLLEVTRVDATGQVRYRFHDLVADYARERAETEESAQARLAVFRRACGAWLALAAAAEQELPCTALARITGATPRWAEAKNYGALIADAAAWFDEEHQSLLSMVAQSVRLGLDEPAWELADSLQSFCELRDLYHEGLHGHRLALQLCERVGNDRGTAVMLRNLAALWTAKPGSSRRQRRAYAQRALQLLRRLGEHEAEADALCLCGDSYRIDGDTRLALATLQEAADTAAAAGHQAGVLHAWQQIAGINREQGRFEESAAYAEKCIALAQQLHSSRDLGVSLMLLGIVRREQGDLPGAEAAFREGITACEPAGDRAQLTYLLAHLGQLYARRRHPAARHTLQRALSLSRGRGLMFGVALSQHGLGELDLAEDHYRSAAIRLGEALEFWRQSGYRFALARTLKCLGLAHKGEGHRQEAEAAWLEARRLFEELDNPTEVRELAQLLDQR